MKSEGSLSYISKPCLQDGWGVWEKGEGGRKGRREGK